MFLKLLLMPLTLYLFLGSYSITFIIMLIVKKSIFHSLWIAFVSGSALLLLWIVCLQICITLLSKKELSYIFNIELPEGETKFYSDLDTNQESELTLDELYSSQDPNIVDNIEFNSTSQLKNNDSSTIDSENSIKPVDQDYSIDSDGTFKMTSNGKTYKATPEEGAKAIRKVLHDDTK